VSNDSRVAEHPERLGALAPIFLRRKIAIAVDGTGELVLVRPDSVVVDLGDTPESFQRAVAAIARYDEERAGELSEQREQHPGALVSVAVPNAEPIAVHGERRWSVEPLQRALDALRGAGAVAEPNHVTLGSQAIRGFPVGGEVHLAGGMWFTSEIVDNGSGPTLRTTSDPAPEPAWLPQRLRLRGHTAPKILILDTGLRTRDGQGAKVEHPYLTCARLHSPWLQNPTPGAIDDEDELDDDGTRTLDFEAGHGTFITGIIQQICPDAEVHIAGVLSSFGDGDVANVVAAFELANRLAGPFDIVNMSFGAYMSDNDGTLLAAALRRLLGDGLGISAVGNQATSRPYFPAALTDIVGVGGLGQNDKAWFTNFGGWVDACAPAIDIVSTFFVHPDSNIDEPVTGWARWSGTSFAAPKVAAVIAREMYLTGVDARTAWTRLSDYRRYRYPDLGTVFNV
jgi:subtilisin family serine protease